MVWPAIIAGAAALAGGALSGDRNRKTAHEQMDAQREFAQMGIQWRVADAKAAGVHPLYAIGAPGASFAPTAVGDSYGPALSAAGQDISRAMQATQDQKRRDDDAATAFMLAREREHDARMQRAHDNYRADLQLQSQLMNDEAQRALIASQIARLNQQRNPPFPSSEKDKDSRGSTDTGAVKLKPSEQPTRDPYYPHREASSIPMWQRVETAPGVHRDFPSRELNMDSEFVHALLAGQAYADKWVSDTFFGGAPKYIPVRPQERGAWAHSTGRGGRPSRGRGPSPNRRSSGFGH